MTSASRSPRASSPEGAGRDGPGRDPVERAALGGPSPVEVAQAVERDAVEPGLLGSPARVEPAARGEHPFEGVGEHVLGELGVPRAIGQEGEQLCEGVFHVAALPSVPRSLQDPLTSNATNVTGTLNVLLAARDEGVGRVVFASSSSVYGANPGLPKHEALPVMPISPYAVAKLAGEGYCRSFFEVLALETVALRYFNVFGPRQDPLSQYSAVIPRFIMALEAGEAPVVHGDGEQSRDFTYVENVVEGTLLAMTAPGVGGKVFNVATGRRVALNELVERLQGADRRRRGARPSRGAAAGRRPALARADRARRAGARLPHHRLGRGRAPSHAELAPELRGEGVRGGA